MSGLPKWQLHRGYWLDGLRENTMQAFEAALEQGADMIELDVRICRSGVIVCFHDSDLSRIFHVDKKISRTSWKDLAGLGLTRLDEVVANDRVPRYLNIELKSESYFPLRLVYGLYRTLRQARKKRYLVSSFNPMSLFLLSMIWPDISRALLIPDVQFVLSWKFNLFHWLSAPRYLHVHHEILQSKEARERLMQKGLPISVWTVNDHVKAAFLLERGAASVISDNPPPPFLKAHEVTMS